MNIKTDRRAFTLAETLVVIGIITLVLALIIPAIQRVRATLDRMACAQKMRQLGFALHAYHADRGFLPPGCSYQNGHAPELGRRECTTIHKKGFLLDLMVETTVS
jgi:competence protein ComGC